jgi:hypothetical protein
VLVSLVRVWVPVGSMVSALAQTSPGPGSGRQTLVWQTSPSPGQPQSVQQLAWVSVGSHTPLPQVPQSAVQLLGDSSPLQTPSPQLVPQSAGQVVVVSPVPASQVPSPQVHRVGCGPAAHRASIALYA